MSTRARWDSFDFLRRCVDVGLAKYGIKEAIYYTAKRSTFILVFAIGSYAVLMRKKGATSTLRRRPGVPWLKVSYFAHLRWRVAGISREKREIDPNQLLIYIKRSVWPLSWPIRNQSIMPRLTPSERLVGGCLADHFEIFMGVLSAHLYTRLECDEGMGKLLCCHIINVRQGERLLCVCFYICLLRRNRYFDKYLKKPCLNITSCIKSIRNLKKKLNCFYFHY